ncbi:MAG: XRE family transcriptional regulator [delta proteobacterium ML8_F1]|nr:MAG: XRE family transcriptional regulator [delta proteobacterium ML8_F1]
MRTRIKEFRLKSGMTQEALASLVGVRRETILHLENNRYNPSLKLAYAVARALDTTIEALFEFEDDD